MTAATFFSVKGRLGPKAFLTASLVLIVVGFLLNLLPLAGINVMLAGVIMLVLLLWPWLAIWIKRLHDAGKSGWIVIAIVIVWLIVNAFIGNMITGMFVDTSDLQAEMIAAQQSQDIARTFALMQEQAQATALVGSIISALIALLFVLAGNALLKQDPTENQYGPPPAG